MVYLNRIYTKGGDAGETSLGNGERVSKTHPRIAAYGLVDELNCCLGLALAHWNTVERPPSPTANSPAADEVARWIVAIQNDLFDLGADLCVPEADASTSSAADSDRACTAAATPPPLRIVERQVTNLERWIDRVNEHLPPLKSFILPGGSLAAAHLHLARTVCRRTEIAVLHLGRDERLNPWATIYLNRLSDLLFVLCRYANADGQSDPLWTPGANRNVADD